MITNLLRSIRDYHNYYLQLYRYDSLYGYNNILRWVYNVPIGLLSAAEALLLVAIKTPMELCGYRFNTSVGRNFQEAIDAIRDSLFAPIVFCYNAIFGAASNIIEPAEEKKVEQSPQHHEATVTISSLQSSSVDKSVTQAKTSTLANTKVIEPSPLGNHESTGMPIPASIQPQSSISTSQQIQQPTEKLPSQHSDDDAILPPGPLELIEAVTLRNVEKVRDLLAHPKVTLDYINNNKNKHGKTAWQIACRNGRDDLDIEIQMLFVQIKGVELPHPDGELYRYYTPLNYIIKLYHELEGNELLRQTAINFINQNDPDIVNAKDDLGTTALMVAVEYEWLEILQELLKSSNIKQIINAHTVINHETALLQATKWSKQWIPGVKALVAAKADVNLPSKTGETPLISAIREESTELLRALLSEPLNLDVEIYEHGSPLTYCSHWPEGIELLLAAKADINFQCPSNGSTVLMRAVQGCFESVYELFKHKEINPDLTNDEGDTALMVAVKKSVSSYYSYTREEREKEQPYCLPIIEFLQYKCNLFIRNHENKTALDIITDKINEMRVSSDATPDLINMLVKIQDLLIKRVADDEMHLNFLFGEHPRLGASSSLLRAKQNVISEPQVFSIVFEFANASNPKPDYRVDNQYLRDHTPIAER
jgi:ankyrin repeat protein